MEMVVKQIDETKIAVNLMQDDGSGLAYTLRAEPADGIACPLHLAEYDVDGSVLESLYLSPQAAAAVAELLAAPGPVEATLSNYEGDDLQVSGDVDEHLITLTDLDEGRSIDLWDEPGARTALAAMLKLGAAVWTPSGRQAASA